AAGPATRLELSTSWRNPPEALTLANAISAPLRSTGVPVGTLRPRPGAGPGALSAALCADVEAERAWVAAQIAAQFTAAAERGDPAPTAAVLVRRNRDSAPMAEHLRGHRSEEHTSELQSRFDLVCRLLLEKKKKAHARA